MGNIIKGQVAENHTAANHFEASLKGRFSSFLLDQINSDQKLRVSHSFTELGIVYKSFVLKK